jgi:hypothetical protein
MREMSHKMIDKDLATISRLESQVRQAAAACMTFWCKEGGRNNKAAGDEDTCIYIHKECSILSLLGGTVRSIQGLAFSMADSSSEGAQEGSSTKTPLSISVPSVKLLSVGNQSAAAALVIVVFGTEIEIRGWLTFLATKGRPIGEQLEDGGFWQCISGAFSAKKSSPSPILPCHFEAVTKSIWDGYCKANRACDGSAMAQVFHETCRLTYVADDNTTVIVPQSAFCDMVQYRYDKGEMHQPYAMIQNHCDIGQHDRLQAIDFASDDLCLVTLKVGHPPCLWTDFLTCCNLGEKDGGGWWIVHKSSCHEEFELTEDMKKILSSK